MIDGEDVVQDTLVKTLRARSEAVAVGNLEGWLFRIAHNMCLDLLRRRTRNAVVPLTDLPEAPPMPDAGVVAIGFAAFLRLPELQRCAVILKDVLGHSVEEVASIAGCTHPAAKSALQRGRAALRLIAAMPTETRLPLMHDAARQKMARFTELFRGGDFDTIRAMLAADVLLDLVNRLQWQGRERIAAYFARYATETKWRFTFGAVEGRPAMLVFDRVAVDRPTRVVLVDWREV